MASRGSNLSFLVQHAFLSVANGMTPPVDSWFWVAALKRASAPRGGGEGEAQSSRSFHALPNPAVAPQPAIETVNPIMVTEGSSATTLTLKGFNFVRRSVVYFNQRISSLPCSEPDGTPGNTRPGFIENSGTV